MTLEVLFAQASQGRTFLALVLCGAAMGLAVQLAGFLHRRSRWLGMAADLLCAFSLAAALAHLLLISGGGLRLYGLLGLCIGGTLHAAGIAPLLRWTARRCTPKGPPPGKAPSHQAD